MAFSPSTVAALIASLSVSGVTITSLANVKNSYEDRDLPVIIPEFGFVTGLSSEPVSMGSEGTALYKHTYTAHYLLLYAEPGKGRKVSDFLSGLLTKVELFANELQEVDTFGNGLYRTRLSGDVVASMVNDPAEKTYIGARLSVSVEEYESQTQLPIKTCDNEVEIVGGAYTVGCTFVSWQACTGIAANSITVPAQANGVDTSMLTLDFGLIAPASTLTLFSLADGNSCYWEIYGAATLNAFTLIAATQAVTFSSPGGLMTYTFTGYRYLKIIPHGNYTTHLGYATVTAA